MGGELLRLVSPRANRSFLFLVLATAGSAVGTYLAAVALSVHIFDTTHSGRWLAALLIADFLPMVLVGLTLGPLVDRLPRRGLMIVADLSRFGIFAALTFVDQPELIVALAALNGVASGFFRPAVWAGMPNLVREDEREAATSLLSTVENAGMMVGPVLSGALLAASGPHLAYWVNAGSFLFSAALIGTLSGSRLKSSDPLTRGHWRDVRDGINLVLRSRALSTVLVVWSTAAVASACVNVAEVILAKDALGAGNVGLGILVSATGAGLVLGSLGAGWALGSFGITRLYPGALALMGIGFGLAGAAPTLAVAAVLAGIAALGNGAAIVCNQVLVQRGAPDAMRGRSLAVLMSVYYAVLGLGMAFAGILTDLVGPRWVWGIAGSVYWIAAVIAYSRTRLIRQETEARLRSEGFDLAQTGATRLEALLGEIEATRRQERERPPRRLPYIPRRRPAPDRPS